MSMPPLTPRQQAEQAYSYAAHDYARNPVGSRDWVLFFTGWSAAMCQQEEARASQAAELEALRADAERWRQFRDGDCSVPAGPDYPAHDLVMARLNNATENYVREGSGVADYDAAVDACAARAALKEQEPNVRANRPDTAAQE